MRRNVAFNLLELQLESSYSYAVMSEKFAKHKYISIVLMMFDFSFTPNITHISIRVKFDF